MQEQISSLEYIYDIRHKRSVSELGAVENAVNKQKQLIKECEEKITATKNSYANYKKQAYAKLLAQNFFSEQVLASKFSLSKYLERVDSLEKSLGQLSKKLNQLIKQRQEALRQVKYTLTKQKKYEFIQQYIQLGD